MPATSLFRYVPGNGSLHRADPRIKVLLAMGLSISTLNTGLWGLVVITVLLVAAILASRIPAARMAGDMRIFWVLAAVIFIATAFRGRDSLTHVGGIFLQGAYAEAGLAVWRFLSIIALSVVLTCTTDPAGILFAAYRFARLFPFLPAGRIATMVSLTVRFVPLVFDEAAEIKEACRSRLIEERRNRAAAIAAMADPLFRLLMRRGEETALAMASRCYEEERISAPPSSRTSGAVVIVAALPVIVAGFLL